MPRPFRIALALLGLCAGLGGPLPSARASDAELTRELLARGEAERALAVADQALAREATDPALGFLRGVALMDLQRNDEALAQFERIAQSHPELPEPHNNIALLHVRAGRLEAARQALEAALRNDPGHRTARANLGLVHLMLARQHWEQLAAGGAVDPALVRRLEALRSLLAAAGR